MTQLKETDIEELIAELYAGQATLPRADAYLVERAARLIAEARAERDAWIERMERCASDNAVLTAERDKWQEVKGYKFNGMTARELAHKHDAMLVERDAALAQVRTLEEQVSHPSYQARSDKIRTLQGRVAELEKDLAAAGQRAELETANRLAPQVKVERPLWMEYVKATNEVAAYRRLGGEGALAGAKWMIFSLSPDECRALLAELQRVLGGNY